MTGTTFALALMWCALRLALWIAEWLYFMAPITAAVAGYREELNHMLNAGAIYPGPGR